jgi:N-acylglucosamine 2-epimerase
MEPSRTRDLLAVYRRGLLEDVIPWWEARFIDEECGGYLPYRDADGTLLSTDKPVWGLARSVWMWSRLHHAVEARDDWLAVARHGLDFLLAHGFDADGRMFWRLTRDGRPLIQRRYLFTECFGVIALAEFARAAGEEEHLAGARELFRRVLHYHQTLGLLAPKVIPTTRRLKGHAMPMILLNVSQILREIDPENATLYDDVIGESIQEVLGHFLKPEKRCLLETVLADGSILDTPEGRTVNPGHAIETSWFLMHEARHRGNDRELIAQATRILEWSLEIGWDREFGGILYFVDCDGKPPEPYEHDMKLWWPHTEALYATLLAHHLTGEARWAEWYERLHAYTFAHFPDREHGEWFGYLHRDGTVASPVKGNHWKGPFHLPRMQLLACSLLEEMAGKGS